MEIDVCIPLNKLPWLVNIAVKMAPYDNSLVYPFCSSNGCKNQELKSENRGKKSSVLFAKSFIVFAPYVLCIYAGSHPLILC